LLRKKNKRPVIFADLGERALYRAGQPCFIDLFPEYYD
jgi:hypothetical protein